MKKSQKHLGLRLDISTLRPLLTRSLERVQGGWGRGVEAPTSFTVCGTTYETDGCLTLTCPRY